MSRHAATLQQIQKFIAAGKPDQARSAAARALQKDPADPWLNNAMAVTFVVQGQHQQAHYYASKAAKAAPRQTDIQCTLGSILCALGQYSQAVETLERAIAADPAAPNPRLAIANSLAGLDRHADVIDHCRAALAHAPGDREITIALMQALLNTGRAQDAVAIAQKAIPTWPQTPELAAWMPYALNYISATTPQQSLAAHRAFAAVLERSPTIRPTAVTPDPDRPLRVGLISPDFRSHSVAFFIEPLLRHADRARLSLVCYSTAPREDPTTQRLRSLADQWRDASKWTALDTATHVRADKVEIFIDLAGLTAGERLGAFIHHPAPVQMTYLGYPNTTGLSCIDYRIVDSHTDPVGAEANATEKLLRLDPCFLCYTPAPGMPEPAPAVPSTAAGHVTFGSFNTLIKLSDETVALWSRLLTEIPGSRLLLKCRQLADPRTREDTAARFVARGIDPSRIETLPSTKTLEDHLATYARLDIGLDPIPYAGTTTTCEAMWMGVPVITLAGQSHASRVGVSLLSNLGMDDLIARDQDQYIDLARRLAADHVRRAQLRSDSPSSLRGRMIASPLCDGPGFAHRFESLLREAWRNWCSRQVMA